MANEIVFLPSFVQNTLAGSAVDTQTVPMTSWPEKPTGTLTSRDQVSVLKMEAGVQQLPEIGCSSMPILAGVHGEPT